MAPVPTPESCVDRGCEKGRTSVADPHYISGAGFRIIIDGLS